MTCADNVGDNFWEENIACYKALSVLAIKYYHKMWHLTPCKISASLSFLNWIKNEMIFIIISELMLAT